MLEVKEMKKKQIVFQFVIISERAQKIYDAIAAKTVPIKYCKVYIIKGNNESAIHSKIRVYAYLYILLYCKIFQTKSKQ